MQLVDSHAHLDFEDFHGDFDTVLKRAEEANITKIINIGASLERSRASIVLAENYKSIFAVVGVHPEESSGVNFDTIHEELLELAKSSKKVIGIGETGLDYNFISLSEVQNKEKEKQKQKELFQIHIDIARHVGLPIVVHIRNGEDEEAVNETYEILKKSGYHTGVIHCFTLDSAWAKRFTELGFYLGFTGIVTYKNAENVRQAVSVTSMEKILIETDCPFLAPQKYRGKRNEPAYVLEVAEEIAKTKKITVAKVANQTTINVENLFGI